MSSRSHGFAEMFLKNWLKGAQAKIDCPVSKLFSSVWEEKKIGVRVRN